MAADPICTALHVTARDGVRIAVDVWRPAELAAGARIGTVLRATRYHRANEGDGVTDEARRWTGWGYALVLVDARGSGASFGSRTAEWSPAELDDYGDVLDWIAAQPWSNGRVGAYGHSYDANAAELLATLGHPSLRAVAPLFGDYDAYEDLIRPGGLENRTMLESWMHMTRALDGIAGAREELDRLPHATALDVVDVKPVDGPDGPALRAAAIAEHQANVDLRAASTAMPFKDDRIGEWGWEERSPFRHRRAAEAAGVPMLVAAGWFDAGTANGALARFLSLDVPIDVYIGAWNHGANFTCDPFAAPDQRGAFEEPQLLERVRELFDRHVQRDEPPRPGRRLHYVALGDPRWRSSEQWPLPGTASDRWYLRAAGGLTPEPPDDDGPDAVDAHRPDPRASAGSESRWGTQVTGGGNVVYPDRAREDRRLSTCTSAPLDRDLHVAGVATLDLTLSASRSDASLIAYLEDVAPDGRVTYLTEGHLRLLCRAVADEQVPHRRLRTPRTFARADSRPMVPGRVERVRLDLIAVVATVRAGHRLRIAIAGADASHVAQLPPDGDVLLTIHRGAAQPSWLELPTVPELPGPATMVPTAGGAR
ncbi:CocE/NonD family hydrolase [Patulibacter defluvii]|uniref:CocE/NonD family hydrolase n=1 Tax=Patulibacter defluvii TaxID=3095358 RepID=UPI002A755A1F|nr:CocE/NonD family hydrolase [Patulibacter sp. DM4]